MFVCFFYLRLNNWNWIWFIILQRINMKKVEEVLTNFGYFLIKILQDLTLVKYLINKKLHLLKCNVLFRDCIAKKVSIKNYLKNTQLVCNPDEVFCFIITLLKKIQFSYLLWKIPSHRRHWPPWYLWPVNPIQRKKCVMCCITPVTWHMSLRPRATATDPPPAYSSSIYSKMLLLILT